MEFSLLVRVKTMTILECWSASKDALLVFGYSKLVGVHYIEYNRSSQSESYLTDLVVTPWSLSTMESWEEPTATWKLTITNSCKKCNNTAVAVA